jgi:uncharacterized protein DUF3891
VIVRAFEDQLLLITQPDHAALAAQIIAVWRRDGFPDAPRRETVLLATRDHDNGWEAEDRTPTIEPVTGKILDFVEISPDVKRRVWPRAIDRLKHHPYAAALVAEHAITVYDRYRLEPSWHAWFAQIEAAGASALAMAAPLTRDDIRRDYPFVRLGDLASLTFCNRWIAHQRFGDYQMSLEADTRLVIHPDPFDGATVPLTIAGRCLPARPFTSADEASEAYAAAPPVTLHGTAVGASRPMPHRRS